MGKCQCPICKGMDYIVEKKYGDEFLNHHDQIGFMIEGDMQCQGATKKEIDDALEKFNLQENIDREYKKFIGGQE